MKKVIMAGSLRKFCNNFCFDFKVTFRGCEAESYQLGQGVVSVISLDMIVATFNIFVNAFTK